METIGALLPFRVLDLLDRLSSYGVKFKQVNPFFFLLFFPDFPSIFLPLESAAARRFDDALG